MKRFVIALATFGLLGVGFGAKSAKAQYFGGGFNPYGSGGYGNGAIYPYGYGPYSGMTSFGYLGNRGYGYGGYGYGGYGYGWNTPQTYNQLGFLAGTVDQLTRQPRRYGTGGFPSRGVRPRAGRRRHR